MGRWTRGWGWVVVFISFVHTTTTFRLYVCYTHRMAYYNLPRLDIPLIRVRPHDESRPLHPRIPPRPDDIDEILALLGIVLDWDRMNNLWLLSGTDESTWRIAFEHDLRHTKTDWMRLIEQARKLAR